MDDLITSILCILILLLFVFFPVMGYLNKEELTVTVDDKWIKVDKNSSIYLVSTDKGVYKISDLLFIGKFNSSDIYSHLEIGKTYNIITTGYRIPFFSWYKNINRVYQVN